MSRRALNKKGAHLLEKAQHIAPPALTGGGKELEMIRLHAHPAFGGAGGRNGNYRE
jgi:hypothetical protein